MNKLFGDLKTDEEKSNFFLSGRGYETGIIAQAIQNDVAMAYHRCAEYRKELEALQPQDRDYEDIKELGGQAVRWAPFSAHWSAELVRLFGPDAREGINELEARLRDSDSDAARWRYIRRKLCLIGNGNGTCVMKAINLPEAIKGWPEPGKVAEFCDEAIDHAIDHARRIEGEGNKCS